MRLQTLNRVFDVLVESIGGELIGDQREVGHSIHLELIEIWNTLEVACGSQIERDSSL